MLEFRMLELSCLGNKGVLGEPDVYDTGFWGSTDLCQDTEESVNPGVRKSDTPAGAAFPVNRNIPSSVPSALLLGSGVTDSDRLVGSGWSHVCDGINSFRSPHIPFSSFRSISIVDVTDLKASDDFSIMLDFQEHVPFPYDDSCRWRGYKGD